MRLRVSLALFYVVAVLGLDASSIGTGNAQGSGCKVKISKSVTYISSAYCRQLGPQLTQCADSNASGCADIRAAHERSCRRVRAMRRIICPGPPPSVRTESCVERNGILDCKPSG